MDTDDLSEMAWSIIVHAAEVSDTLKAELGAMSRKCKNEEEWLQEVQVFLQEIIEAPEEYVKFWDLEEYEGVNASMMNELAIKLHSQTVKLQTTPMSEWEKD